MNIITFSMFTNYFIVYFQPYESADWSASVVMATSEKSPAKVDSTPGFYRALLDMNQKGDKPMQCDDVKKQVHGKGY